MPKVRKTESSFFYMTRHLILFFISIKYHQNIPKVVELQSGHEFKNKTKGETPKEGQSESSLLYVMCRLVLFCISTKYHQNVLKGIPLTEQKA